MKLSEELQWRGFINQTTYDDLSPLDGEPISFYWGVDPSADSMHIGQLAMALMIRHFIDHGHKATLLVGGATGMIGDPDGKLEERELKPLEEVEYNKNSIANQYRSLFADQPFEIVDNFDWFKDMGYLNFLREIGKNVPLSSMLGREFVQTRLGADGNGISYAEFSYSLIQGYDFLHLFREKGITLQVSGADQWGNSVTGVQLIRKLENAEANVYTAPLILNKNTGRKFGKSEEGAVWLDTNKTSVYKFYQFWLNVDDAGVIDYLKIFTLLPKVDIDHIAAETQANPSARLAQKTLAHEVTKLVHGEERVLSVEKVTASLFDGAGVGDLTDDELEMLTCEIPTTAAGQLVESLVVSGLAASNGDAKRLISNGAISVNGQKVSDDIALIAPSMVKKGKNSFLLVR